ncbi:MAG: hypothetical protein K9G36_00760 [Crocinitomicaceae bacterium]|nr:hypothetical protein [Crocinitomicaceae bacterium]MCF8410552.1 hypothetical protein [Crocinitomicaceae bacterium]
MFFRHVVISFIFALFVQFTIGQTTTFRTLKIKSSEELIDFDTLSVYPSSFTVSCNGSVISAEKYVFDFAKSTMQLQSIICDSVVLNYRVFSFDISQPYKKRDLSIIFNGVESERERFMIQQMYSVDDVFGGSEINKQGSISRGVSFGNNQDLGINSSLNLELSGQISPKLKLLASVSDANIPIQPDGTTNKLQEFDQLFIQVYSDDFKVIAGDFWLNKPEGYFLNYRKRAQGLTSTNTFRTKNKNVWFTQISGALSKGKFNRQIIQGIESNQGPYRLKGSENEPFIIVLAGTERVFIDGKSLERGQEFDYTIDYNTSEVIFTSRNLITKDSRIVVEFQYSDQNYARSLVQSSTTYQSKKVKFWLNVYSEQDAKTQSLQQKLTLGQKSFLATIGDDLSLARLSSIDSVGYSPNQIHYKLIDSLGFDSVLVFSNNIDSAKYTATFIYVGPNMGDYQFDQQIAFGKIYKWVKPIAGVSQGEYNPARLIATPKKKQFISSGIQCALSKRSTIFSELAISNADINTFSTIGNDNNKGFAGKINWKNKFNLTKDTTQLIQYENAINLEYLSFSFEPIEQFRKVEFDRDWNIRNMNYSGNQSIFTFENAINSRKNGTIKLDLQHLSIGNQFQGNRLNSEGNWKYKGWGFNWDGSYLNSNALSKSNFLRHRASITKNIGTFQVSFKDDHEKNLFLSPGSILNNSSYQFYDYQFAINKADSSKMGYKVIYRERYDWRPKSNSLQAAAKATTASVEIDLKKSKNNQLAFISGLRSLKILDSTLLAQKPENTLIGRLEYNSKLLQNSITLSTFYEIGSGLEQQKDFIYLKVNDGQGIYTWIDYDGDGIEDLNEFEIAQFIDQASYIRIFIPSSTYSKTYSNEFNGSLFIRPERLLTKKEGVLKHVGKLSNQFRMRVMKKTANANNSDLFNPFQVEIRDTNLISATSSIRNSVYFNRNSTVFGMEYNFQDNRSKSLLASGFDSKKNRTHELVTRWNITKTLTILNKFSSGLKVSQIDYTINRNYEITQRSGIIDFSYQPTTTFRIGGVYQLNQKWNSPSLGNEISSSNEFSINAKYNESQKGSLLADIKTVLITFQGVINSAIAYEMMEGLRIGDNYVWSLSYQRVLSKNLQLSIQYSGRKSGESKIIHTGGMELRALF